jgi:predicted transcriptional regulator
MELHIGEEIKKVLEEKGLKPDWLAKKISTSRRNLYDILKREEIGTNQLLQISKALNYDFFSLYQDESFSTVSDSSIAFEKKPMVMVSVQLDGSPATAEYWISKIKKLNAAIA